MKLIADRVAIVLLAISTCSVGLASASARPSASLRGGAAAAAAAAAAAVTNANPPAADSLEQQPPPQPRRLDTTVVSCMSYDGQNWNLLQNCDGLQCSWPGVPCGEGTAEPDCNAATTAACSASKLSEWSLTIHTDGSPATQWYACCT
jgi:hypothetical protein